MGVNDIYWFEWGKNDNLSIDINHWLPQSLKIIRILISMLLYRFHFCFQSRYNLSFQQELYIYIWSEVLRNSHFCVFSINSTSEKILISTISIGINHWLTQSLKTIRICYCIISIFIFIHHIMWAFNKNSILYVFFFK